MLNVDGVTKVTGFSKLRIVVDRSLETSQLHGIAFATSRRSIGVMQECSKEGRHARRADRVCRRCPGHWHSGIYLVADPAAAAVNNAAAELRLSLNRQSWRGLGRAPRVLVVHAFDQVEHDVRATQTPRSIFVRYKNRTYEALQCLCQ